MTKTKLEPSEHLTYTLADAAKVVGRSRSRIKKAIKAGELTIRRDGQFSMIERDELVRWVTSWPVLGREGVKNG